MNSKLESAIWSYDTNQQIPCFDRCQLTITWISNIKDERYKSRFHDLAALSAGHHVARQHCLMGHVPMIHAANHIDHEKTSYMVFYM